MLLNYLRITLCMAGVVMVSAGCQSDGRARSDDQPTVYTASQIEQLARAQHNQLAAGDALGARVFASHEARVELARLRNVELPSYDQTTEPTATQPVYAEVPVHD